MSYAVVLRENATGIERRIEGEDVPAGPWSEWEWFWTQGNYGCDCNRELIFKRHDPEAPDVADVECGESRYTLVCVYEDGQRIEVVDDQR